MKRYFINGRASRSLLLVCTTLLFWLAACDRKTETPAPVTDKQTIDDSLEVVDSLPEAPKIHLFIVPITRDVKASRYFAFMDSIVLAYDSLVDYQLTEHLLVHANPWIIDSLESYDYYTRKEKGQFIEDQKETIALRQGAELIIPNNWLAVQIQDRLNKTIIDVNIPEFVLRIMEDTVVKYSYPVRVGRYERKYLELAKNVVNLQTPIGEGEIVRIERDPWFINPANGHRYFATRRDDGKYTKLPLIPWIEPSINGTRPGSLIHPTTNPETLGKPYSNGCVGTPEGAAWRIYYYAPLGTKVRFRYDLDVVNENGDTLHLKDIYHRKKKETPRLIASLSEPVQLKGNPSIRISCTDIGLCH